MKILLVDYGSYFFKDIKISLDLLGVKYHCVKFDEPIEKLNKHDLCGIILSGGPGRVNNPNDPQLNLDYLKLYVPILGICYGLQVLMKSLGGKVEALNVRDYGVSKMSIDKYSILNEGIENNSDVFMSHFDHVSKLAPGFDMLAKTNISIAMIEDKINRIYAVQYHPEANRSENDMQLFKNFIYKICKYK